MKSRRSFSNMSRRERQIMEVLYRDGSLTATEVLARIPDPPSYSAVRAMLRVLENKGHARHVADGTRYVYTPTLPRERAGGPALANVLETFFDGSTEKAVAALLDLSRQDLSEEDLDRLSRLIEQARQEGR
ncbi:MAG TPA: BlaI/MecI/CopY family transcriptional regulator [Thermoanaerobaculia bacterium]|jgi:predicted transcriptional regulator|nr:BlaI/MecI/CopY family transcriptional regulator [Thermoanaerobaculia bacterium]